MTVDGTPLVTFTTETDTINLDLYFRLKRASFENQVNVKVREASVKLNVKAKLVFCKKLVNVKGP